MDLQQTEQKICAVICRSNGLKAREIASETGLPIIDVGTAVGLDDQAYFARFFRRLTGMTPSAFRKAMHE